MIEKDRKRILLSDHDGTITDSEREAEEYASIVREFMSETLSVPQTEIGRLLEESYKEIRANSEVYGWKVGEVIVAPAMSDHYILNTVAARMVLEKLSAESASLASFKDRETAEAYATRIFKECSPRLGVFYRSGAESFLRDLQKSGDFRVITNSDPVVVTKKLGTLLGTDAEKIAVVGNAKKYAVNLSWEGVVPVGAYREFPGFPERGVNLQRHTYYMTLMDITSGDISRAKMVGDIAELDLLMIDYLGGETALIMSGNTASWERNYYTKGGDRRFASSNLEEIASWMTR